ncbi:MAG: RpiR family transcriptional regulator [Rhizobiales bacterium 65-79]|jgi:DNA-binding MurR/RpiR family transcriptional regulator|nr:MurR/RpiR family transcriptional regulator [Hyphomicrobiales bacterium]OJU06710.1 MAG: RpiR family transcriptional regulator [Rhizobiales bacterium 65-79]
MNEAETLAAPRDFESLRAMIITRRQSLPKRLAQVAAHTLDNPDEIAFGTAASIAAAADVQPSTLVRFAQHFGFEGFSDLQRIFRDRLKERTNSYEERLAALRAGAGTGSHESAVLDGFLDAARRSLDKLSHAVEAPKLERAVAILADARTIHLIARRRSYPISTYMAYAFGKLGIRCTLVGSPVGIDAETLALAGNGDAAIAVSFSPYASETAEYARNLAARGVPVVAITDSAFSPLAEHATEWFEVAEADFAGFRSLSATMALAMALTVSVAERRADLDPKGKE